MLRFWVKIVVDVQAIDARIAQGQAEVDSIRKRAEDAERAQNAAVQELHQGDRTLTFQAAGTLVPLSSMGCHSPFPTPAALVTPMPAACTWLVCMLPILEHLMQPVAQLSITNSMLS